MFESIRRVLLRYIEVGDVFITEDTRLQEDLCLNSLDYIYILMDLEDAYDFTFSEEDVGHMRTVGDIERAMEKEMAS